MSPVSLYFTDFEDERGQVRYYLPRLRELDVPIPRTTFVPLEETDGDYRWNTDRILSFMADNEYDRAFVRTQVKAATVRLREGSFVHRRDPDVVDGTVRSLLNQNDQQGWPHGGGLVVREWLDLDFCPHPTHSCHPSVRFFVDAGDVLGQTPIDARDHSFVCSNGYEYVQPLLADVDFSTPREHAERIAAAFPEATWGVDFALDTTGEWYCTEFNFNGVYWNREHEQWWNKCGQGAFEPWSPVEVHSAALWGVRPSAEPDRDGWW